MKVVSIFLGLILGVSIAWGQETVKKEFKVGNFDELSVKTSIDAELIVGDAEKVVVECKEEYLKYVKVEVEGRKLSIWLDTKKFRKKRKWTQNISIFNGKKKIIINGVAIEGGIKAKVYVKNIKEIKASSSASISWNGKLPTDDLEIDCSSSGYVYWTGLLDVAKVEIDCSSSGDVKGDIKAKEFEIDLNSSADYKGNVEAQTVKVALSSSADFKGQIIAETADFEINSSADFIGKVDANKATFDMSSSADAKVDGIINFLFVEASSSADFKGKGIVYKKAEVETSSSGDIYLSKSGEVIDHTPRRTGVFVE